MKFRVDPRSRRVTKSGFRCAIWMVQHRIFIKKPVDVCKMCPSKNQRSQTVPGRSGQGLDFCHWSLKILIFWYRPFAKLFLPLSILSDPKQIGNISLDVCKNLRRRLFAHVLGNIDMLVLGSVRGRRLFAHVLGNIDILVPRGASQEVECVSTPVFL